MEELVSKAELQEFSDIKFKALAGAVGALLVWNKHLIVGQVIDDEQEAERNLLVANIESLLDDGKEEGL